MQSSTQINERSLSTINSYSKWNTIADADVHTLKLSDCSSPYIEYTGNLEHSHFFYHLLCGDHL